MTPSDIEIEEETLTQIRERVLQEENSQLHFERPPEIIQDLKKIIEEEITEVEYEESEV